MSQHPFRAACTPIVQRALLVLGGAFLLFAPPAGAGRVRPQTSGPVFEAFSIPSVAAGKVRGVSVDGSSQLAAVVSDGQGLTVVDLSTGAMRLLKSSGIPYGVLVVGEMVYVAETTTNGSSITLRAVDATKTKSALSVTQSVGLKGSFAGYGGNIALDDWVLYVAGSSAGLQLVDVSRAAYPSYLGAAWTSSGVSQVAVSDTRAAAFSYGGARFGLFDTLQPNSPRVLSDLPSSLGDIDIDANLVLLGSTTLQMVDYSDTTRPKILASTSLASWPGGNFSFWGAEIVDFPTLTSLRVFRQNPPLQLIGQVALDWTLSNWAVDAQRIYAVDTGSKLHVLERNF